ncbi:hypothetical protein [Faecalicoccus acidiformans]|uniref:Transposase n=1 Tax=Faecalicoccus acidiformans TaxID=915173 RepID=A0ABS2FNX7_9FIRM|nr:hypothetical protein [Faecalicoccus acidiformans]MBM6831006.1 hypothetical protein [Faecalicoccus acidiformans]
MKNSSNLNALREIILFINRNRFISYYDLKKYAYKEKEEWIPIFKDRHCVLMIKESQKSLKRKYNLKYDKPTYIAMQECLEAEIDYEQNSKYRD